MEMSRKKHEKESLAEETKSIPIQADELFLQAYEKPVLIYRYYRARNILTPSFLYRTLSYMKDRSIRNNQRRRNFQVDSLLQLRLNEDRMQKANIYGNYLHIVYLGLFNEQDKQDLSDDVVKIEVTLSKVPRSIHRDKKVPSDKNQILLSDVFINHVPNGKYPVINIPFKTFKVFGETLNYLYKISFYVEVMSKSTKNTDDGEEQAAKRPRPNSKYFRSELDIWDNDNTFIGSAEYETKLREVNSTIPKTFLPNETATWETELPGGEAFSTKYNGQLNSPVLRFHLSWSNDASPVVIDSERLKDMAKPSTYDFTKIATNYTETTNILQISNNNNVVEKVKTNSNTTKDKQRQKAPFQITYNFMYNNNTRQQTEYSRAMVCPWCEVNCVKLYSLLNHLKLCHGRFNFTYQPAANGARIDVTINDSYDGSYAGSPYDLAGPGQCAFPRDSGPTRRTTMTDLMVCRPRRQKPGLAEFLDVDEDELSNQRTYVTGHNRLYYHTETCLPVHPKELDVDSEGENDPAWLRHKTVQMIDEFSDVNEGEKELMKMWNLHVMKNGYVGDCQLSIASEMFVDHHGVEIIKKNLYRNFILHMCSLFDYGLIAPEVVYKAIQRLQNVLSTCEEGQKVLAKSHELQLNYWLDVGMRKQEIADAKKRVSASPAIAKTLAICNTSTPIQYPTSATATQTTSNDTPKKPADWLSSSLPLPKVGNNTTTSTPLTSNGSTLNGIGGNNSIKNSDQKKDSPTRSRSASITVPDVPRRLITRRQSVAIVNGHNLLSNSSNHTPSSTAILSTSLRSRNPKN